MAVVSRDEQERRERKGSRTVGILALALLLGAPLIGLIAAFFAAFWMAGKAYTKSSNRLVDVSLALGGLIPYILIVWAAMGNKATGVVGMWFAVSLYSLAWVWLMQARIQVVSD